MRIPVIYMAAGNGRRFADETEKRSGRRENKLLRPYKGKPLYRHGLERLAELKEEGLKLEIYLVSQYRELLEDAKDLPALPVYSPESRNGASYTVRAGLWAAGFREEGGGETDQEGSAGQELLGRAGCAFFAADQPCLEKATMARFFERVRRNPAGLAAVGQGREPGNPCYFGPGYLPELFKLKGDKGGKPVLRKYLEECAVVQAREWELEDVDVPVE